MAEIGTIVVREANAAIPSVVISLDEEHKILSVEGGDANLWLTLLQSIQPELGFAKPGIGHSTIG